MTTKRAPWILGLFALGTGVARVHADPTTVKADTFWFSDDRSEAGGAATHSNAANWSLGQNTATISANNCNDVKAQINGTKMAQAGQEERILKAQCAFSGSVATSSALGES